MSRDELAGLHRESPFSISDLYWNETLENWLPVTSAFVRSLLADTPQTVTSPESIEKEEPVSTGPQVTNLNLAEQKEDTSRPESKTVPTTVSETEPNTDPSDLTLQKVENTVSNPKPRVVSRIPASDVSEVDQRDAPVGLGGWMVIPAIIAGLMLVGSVALIFWYGQLVIRVVSNPGLYEILDTLEIAIVLIIALAAVLAILLWSLNQVRELLARKSTFPSTFRAGIGFFLILGIILTGSGLLERWGITNFTDAIEIPQKYLEHTINVQLNILFIAFICVLVLVGLFVALSIYLQKSRRVKNTFIE